jgi:hypothetical protein
VFPEWACHLPDRRGFFRALLEAASEKVISDSRVVEFALASPCDFFDEILRRPRFSQLTDLLFQRWASPDRGVLLHFMVYVVEHIPKGVDFERMFTSVTQKITYVGNCKQFLAIANDEGELMVIGKDSAKILWKQKCFSNPIKFVSVNAGGERIAVISLKEGLLTWIAVTRVKTVVTGFELAGTVMLPAGIAPVTLTWKGASKIRLESQDGHVLKEIAAPKTGWIF